MYPGLVSCPFNAIPIYPFKFMIYLSPFIFLLPLKWQVAWVIQSSSVLYSSAELNRFPIRPATFARSAAHA